MKNVVLYIIFSCLGTATVRATETPILERRISVNVQKQTLARTLVLIGQAGDFYFSYSSSVLRANRIVSIKADKQTVREVLDRLFDGELSYQQIGKHLVLQKKPRPRHSQDIQAGQGSAPVKYSYVISGYIRDAKDGNGIGNVSVYEKQTLSATVSGEFGYYTLTVSSRSPQIDLRFSCAGYRDTVMRIRFAGRGLVDCPLGMHAEVKEAELAPAVTDTPVIRKDSLGNAFIPDSTAPVMAAADTQQMAADAMAGKRMKVEDTRAGKWVISTLQKINEKNIRDSLYRNWQVTFFPPMGSNGELSGLVQNRFSLNLIAGYNGSLDGAEFGGLLNVLRKDMRGAQFAGFGNVVGGDVSGAQFAGFFNHNLGRVNAAQFAGFYNYNHFDATGAQFAGFINLNRGVLTGIQAAGFMNIAESGSSLVQGSGFMNISNNITGVQGAGFMNVAGGDNVLVQGAGFMNIADKIDGVQGAGFMNICGHLHGVQAAGFMNIGGDMTGLQAAGFMNIGGGVNDIAQFAGFMNVADEIRGGQVAGFMNIARKVRGYQIGIFNIADTVEGLVLGVFSFIRNGLHQVEFSYNENGQYGIAYRSGKEWLYSNVMMTAQWPDRDSGTLITQGFGLGGNIRLHDAFRITSDFTVHQLTVNLRSDHLNLQSRLNVSLEWRPVKGFAVFGGAALNHMINDTRHYLYETRFKDFGGPALWSRGGTYAQKVWNGWQFGVRLL